MGVLERSYCYVLANYKLLHFKEIHDEQLSHVTFVFVTGTKNAWLKLLLHNVRSASSQKWLNIRSTPFEEN